MAKGRKKNQTPVVETPVVETVTVETPVVETVTVETPVVETPVVETETVETPVVKRKEKTPKESFEESISKGAFQIYQNGVLVCNSSPFMKIETYDNYFQINFRKFAYSGIEVRLK